MFQTANESADPRPDPLAFDDRGVGAAGATQSPTRSTLHAGVPRARGTAIGRVRRDGQHDPVGLARHVRAGRVVEESTRGRRASSPMPHRPRSVDCTMPLAAGRIHQFSMSSVMPRSWPTTMPG